MCLKAELHHIHQTLLTERERFQRRLEHWERKDDEERERKCKEEFEKARFEQMKKDIQQRMEFEDEIRSKMVSDKRRKRKHSPQL